MPNKDYFKVSPPKTYEVFHLEEQQIEPTKLVSKQASTVIDDPASNRSQDTYFVLSSTQLKKLKLVSETIFRLTNDTLLDMVKQKNFESWMEVRYGVVKPLWSDDQAGVNLMRIDYAWDQEGNFKVLELNTASHSGWIKSGLTEQEASAAKVGLPLAPEFTFYAQYLLKKLGPRIAIIVIRENYQKQHKELTNWIVDQIETLGGKCQITYLSENNIQDIIDFNPSGIFWKTNSKLVEYSDLVFKLAQLDLPQIPSFTSLFIAGDKAFLATLRKKDTTGAIPQTYVLSKSDLANNFDLLAKDRAVLKPGDLSRGEGIKFGKYFEESAWQTEIEAATNSHEEWVIQELCYLKRAKDGRYEDITVFLADRLVKGVSSRISTNEIMNVSRGGVWQSVVLNCEEEKIN
jgi:glutathione synthase/RimK-type ligase-like ATP-grasp enzyme